MHNKTKQTGQVAYESFTAAAEPSLGKGPDVCPLPTWDELPSAERHRWAAAAGAVALKVGEEVIRMFEAGGGIEPVRHTMRLKYEHGPWDAFANDSARSDYARQHAGPGKAITYSGNLA